VDICASIAQTNAESARKKDPESIRNLEVQEEWGAEIIQVRKFLSGPLSTFIFKVLL